jgi:plastocyanin
VISIRRSTRPLLAGVLIAMLLPLTGAQAATYSVSVTSDSFSPGYRQVAAGDTILWVWAAGGHNVTAFSGASFASGDRPANATFTQTYPGGVVKYRCTNHSSVAGGECSGMCGLITEKPIDITPPTVSITAPQQGQLMIPVPRVQGGIVNQVTVQGNASDNVGVFGVLLRVYDTTGRATDFPATCNGCEDQDVTWRIDLNLLPGSYVVEARASDTSGNIRWSPRTSFIVL